MHAWESIESTLNYIEEHYDQDITIQQLSDIAHLSSFYFQRLFNRLVGKTVFEYIKLRRLSKSISMLKETEDKIVDISIRCGFNSHQTFSKTFKEIYRLTPTEFRNSPYHLDYFIKPDLTMKYTMIDENIPLVCDDMVLEICRKEVQEEKLFIGIKQRNPINQINEPKVNTMAPLWDKLKEDTRDLEKVTTLGVGVDILLPTEDPAYFDYICGFEASHIVDNYNSWTMPKGPYIVCTYEAENFDTLVNESLYKVSQYIFEIWLPKHKIVTAPFILQKYFNPEQEGCYMETWLLITKE